ncbi:MAG TPA: tyrosine-type recombinase/integrase, partial [Candidatus Eisenbacteria bacterium]|nr:tyrosine-type recombinase/integrase [Candidatus Eisenbacteria bacterium]
SVHLHIDRRVASESERLIPPLLDDPFQADGLQGRLAEKAIANLSSPTRRDLAGLERFHVHQTRHTFACRYLEAGGTLTMLQEILGHASMEQTQQYGRPDARAIRSDADHVFARWEAQTGNKTGNIAVLGVPGSMQ